jgi:hypothetical protein
LRTSPAPLRIRHNPAPTTADRAQAAVTAQLLAELIHDCDARIAAANEAAAEAERKAIPDAQARQLALASRLRRELAELQAMDRRLVLRFQDTGTPQSTA